MSKWKYCFDFDNKKERDCWFITCSECGVPTLEADSEDQAIRRSRMYGFCPVCGEDLRPLKEDSDDQRIESAC